MKKFLSGILASTMLLSSLSMVTLATETQENYSQETAVYTQTLASSESDFTMGDGGVITKYTGSGGNVVIPSSIGGQTVYGIGASAFQNVSSIESVTMPSSLERIEQYAFDGCYNLRSVELNEGLEYLGRDSFARTTNLGAIWIPSSVVEFARGVFYQSGLTTAYVPSSVRVMGTHVFQECQRLSQVIIMANIDVLPESTFLNSVVLKDVHLGEGIATIGPYAFSGNKSLSAITMPSTLKYINQYAFYGCTKLEKLDFSNTQLISVDLAAFQYCYSLKEAIFPFGFQKFAYGENYMYTDKAQFYGCGALEKVVLPSTVNSCYWRYTIPNFNVGLVLNYLTNNYEILNHPFVNCSPTLEVESYGSGTVATLASYTNTFSLSTKSGENTSGSTTPTTAPSLPTKGDMVVTEVTPIPTPNASAESDFVLGDGGMITSYTGAGGDVAIPSTIGGKPVYAIGGNVFQNKTNIESITMPNTLKRIEGYAFDGCTNLRSVTLNEGLEYLGRDCFARTSNLRDIWIPTTVVELARGVFYQSGLTSAYVPATVRIMGTHVFQECPRLTSAIIMADIDQLPQSTFLKSLLLDDVYLREGILTIGTSAFSGCTGLQQITLPTTTANIYEYAFFGCSKLQKMDMSNTRLSRVDLYAFQYCTSLTEVVFPFGFKTFPYGDSDNDKNKGQFRGCTSLTKVVLPSTLDTCYFYRNLGVMAVFNHPFKETNSSLVIYSYPGTAGEALANKASTITFSSLGEITSETQTRSYTPAPVPTLPTAPVTSTPTVTTPTTPTTPEVPSWAETYVNYAISSGILPNISASNMDSASSRGLIAQALYNYAGNGANVTPTHKFTDTGDYSKAIAWCYENGIMSGMTEATFGTNGNVTREQFALILRALAKFEGKDVSGDTSTLSKFSDQNLMNDWAKEGIAWAVNAGLMEGNNGKLDPQGAVTQVQVSIMMMKM